MFETVKEVIIDILSCPAEKVTLEADLFKDLAPTPLTLWNFLLQLRKRPEFQSIRMPLVTSRPLATLWNT